MQNSPVTPELLAGSVIAVPPLARNDDESLNRDENEKLVRHIEAGGVTTLLYGGNANLYHIRPGEYADLLEMLSGIAGDGTTVIPAVGPAYGTMMDQAEMLRGTDFPAVMVLPQSGLTTDDGVLTGLRRFAEHAGKPIVVYLKAEGYLSNEGTQKLVEDGIVSWIKYAIVRDDPADDPLLCDLVERVDPEIIVSGIGEQPALVHLREFGLVGFTAGCVCVAPALSQELLHAIKSASYERAEEIRGIFKPLEDLRNGINPVRVLHEAVDAAGICRTGPILPLLSAVNAGERKAIEEAVAELI